MTSPKECRQLKRLSHVGCRRVFYTISHLEIPLLCVAFPLRPQELLALLVELGLENEQLHRHVNTPLLVQLKLYEIIPQGITADKIVEGGSVRHKRMHYYCVRYSRTCGDREMQK